MHAQKNHSTLKTHTNLLNLPFMRLMAQCVPSEMLCAFITSENVPSPFLLRLRYSVCKEKKKENGKGKTMNIKALILFYYYY